MTFLNYNHSHFFIFIITINFLFLLMININFWRCHQNSLDEFFEIDSSNKIKLEKDGNDRFDGRCLEFNIKCVPKIKGKYHEKKFKIIIYLNLDIASTIPDYEYIPSDSTVTVNFKSLNFNKKDHDLLIECFTSFIDIINYDVFLTYVQIIFFEDLKSYCHVYNYIPINNKVIIMDTTHYKIRG